MKKRISETFLVIEILENGDEELFISKGMMPGIRTNENIQQIKHYLETNIDYKHRQFHFGHFVRARQHDESSH